MEHLPLGCVFKPKVKEIYKYLHNKVHAIQEPKVNLDLIPELDVYQVCPSDLQGLSTEGYTYFFTRRLTKKDLVSRNDRQTKDGKGYWSASTGQKSEGGGLLIKRTLVYYLKAENVKGRGQKTNWIMHEYELNSADEKAKVNEKIVLCGVYQRKQNKDTETEEEEIKSTQESQQQKNTAAEAKEESACVDLTKKIDQSHQSDDQHKNTTSTAGKELDLTLQLWPGEHK